MPTEEVRGAEPLPEADVAVFDEWWDDVRSVRTMIDMLVKIDTKLRWVALELQERAEFLISEVDGMREIAEEGGRLEHWRRIVTRLCEGWAALVRVYDLPCRERPLKTCRPFLTSVPHGCRGADS